MVFLLRLTFNNIWWNKLTLSHSGRTRRTFSLCFCQDVYSMICISSVICSTLLVSCSVFCGKAWQTHCWFYRHRSVLIHVFFFFIVKLNPSHQINQLIKALRVNKISKGLYRIHCMLSHIDSSKQLKGGADYNVITLHCSFFHGLWHSTKGGLLWDEHADISNPTIPAHRCFKKIYFFFASFMIFLSRIFREESVNDVIDNHFYLAGKKNVV